MLHWLWVALIGLVIGAVAKLIMPGKDPGGFIITGLLGIAGSIVATWIGRAVGWYAEGHRLVSYVSRRSDFAARNLRCRKVRGSLMDRLAARLKR